MREKFCFLAMASVIAAGLGFFIGCGGGGGDVAPPGPPPPLPETLTFGISTPPGEALALTFPEGGATLTEVGLHGTVTMDPGTGNLVFTLDPGLNGNMTGTWNGDAIGPYAIWTSKKISFTAGELPTSGENAITYGLPSPSNDTAVVAVDDSIPGVRISGFGTEWSAGPDPFPWETFINLADDDLAPEYRKVACFGFLGWYTVFSEPAMAAIEWIRYIDENYPAIEGAGGSGITLPCDLRPDGGPTGTKKIVVSPLGPAGPPADDFTISYTNCYVDLGDPVFGAMIRGTVSLDGFILNDTPFSIGGEAVFTGFTISETEYAGGVLTEQHPHEYAGSLNLFFSE